ncbi:hypothetical protein [Actinomycetospora lemnae]|uniref:Uncharacterized protein n=1 Tax=Actinomycetospora lemnae TaxID=3019891 RepID=A0ABT5SXE7_9PSEU|nr:hypothetical protein [Actinomycetospora sp. DW7H6]MDD7967528.1 hypothetical protein [Actinomycetospora sp. DW7H6]
MGEPERGDVVLRSVATPDAAPEEHGDTRVDVALTEQDRPADPCWPVGVAIGFW